MFAQCSTQLDGPEVALQVIDPPRFRSANIAEYFSGQCDLYIKERNLFSEVNLAERKWKWNRANQVDLTSVIVYSEMRGARFSGVLITPYHVLMAAHATKPKGDLVYFVGRDDTTLIRVVREVKSATYPNVLPDLAIGRLDAPIIPSDGVSICPVFPVGNYEWVGAHVLVLDQRWEVSRFPIIGIVQGPGYEMLSLGDWSETVPMEWKSKLVGGDSGWPQFMIVNGRLVLVGLNTWGDLTPKGPWIAGRENRKTLLELLK